jgi:hypothetical protein
MPIVIMYINSLFFLKSQLLVSWIKNIGNAKRIISLGWMEIKPKFNHALAPLMDFPNNNTIKRRRIDPVYRKKLK